MTEHYAYLAVAEDDRAQRRRLADPRLVPLLRAAWQERLTALGRA